jgi:hypothetical protein
MTPLFVKSHLTRLIQLADVVAYCLNWGHVPYGSVVEMTEVRRPDIIPLAQMIWNRKYTFVDQRTDEPFPSIYFIDDPRPSSMKTL